MPILNFTVNYDDLMNDVDDNSGDIGTVGGVGWVYFETRFPPGARIPALDYSPRPSGFGLRTFKGYLDADGRLKNKAGGTPGVRLWANDPVFNLDRLAYRVSAELTDPMGREVPFHQFEFDARTADVPLDLATVMPKPGQKFSRGPAAPGIADAAFNGEGDLVITLDDGTELPPMEIPEGTLVFVDNGDGTITVGP